MRISSVGCGAASVPAVVDAALLGGVGLEEGADVRYGRDWSYAETQ